MRKLGIAALIASAALLGACSKNNEKCCEGGQCKDKAAVKMSADATPAGGEKKCCSDKASCKDKAAGVNATTDAVPAGKQCEGAKSGCCKSKQNQQ